MASSRDSRIIMLGQDHDRYGEVDTASTETGVGAAISVGGDQRSPSLQFKGTTAVPNEDALMVSTAGEYVLMAVADAHFGHEASHQLVVSVDEHLGADPPGSVEVLAHRLETLGAQAPPALTSSESTFAIAVLDREHRQVFGMSFGDSSAALVGPSGFRLLNERDDNYVTADRLLHVAGRPFVADVETGDLLVMYTDGVDECHYRHPATSLQGAHVLALAQTFGGAPEIFAGQLAAQALAGVDGNPGGQDNIAIVAATT